MNRTRRPPPTSSRPGKRTFSRLQKDILRTLLYFDVFDHPLTLDEVFRFLPSNSVSFTHVERAIAAAPLAAIVTRTNGYLAVNGTDDERAERLTRERPPKEARAGELLRIARSMSRLIGSFPFVRAVFVTGEVSKGVAVPGADIDFLVATRANRLWIARTLLIGFKKIFLLNSKRFFCLNHIMSEIDLVEENRNRYIAVEIGTVLPILNTTLHRRYIESNDWIRSYLPNLTPTSIRTEPLDPYLPRPLRAALESPLRGSLGDRLDLWLMNAWRGIWKRRHPELTQEQRDTLFRCERNVSTAYAGDFQPKILRAYEERLGRFGLRPSQPHG